MVSIADSSSRIFELAATNARLVSAYFALTSAELISAASALELAAATSASASLSFFFESAVRASPRPSRFASAKAASPASLSPFIVMLFCLTILNASIADI